MFCYKCGAEIQDDSLFCCKCGAAQNTVANTVTTDDNQHNGASRGAIRSIEKTNNDVNERQGVSIYINDILKLEFISNKLQEKRDGLLERINACNDYIPMRSKEYRGLESSMYRTGIIKFMYGYDGTFYHFDADYQQSGTQPTEYGGYQTVYWYSSDLNNGQIFSEYTRLTSERLAELSKPLIEKVPKLFGGYRENILGNWCPNNLIGYISPEFRDIFLDDLSTFKPQLKLEWDTVHEQIPQLEEELSGVEKELQEASALLEKEYSLNIIPGKFRSLAAIYYICDYFNTSNETLGNILFHLDLDEIKKKLDTVIQNQEQIIINQAIQIAQNQELINQNQRILGALCEIADTSAQIEQNTADAAQWAKIAANNAEACAWIGAANYIKG